MFNLIDAVQEFLREHNVQPDDSATTQSQSLWHQWQQRISSAADAGGSDMAGGGGAGAKGAGGSRGRAGSALSTAGLSPDGAFSLILGAEAGKEGLGSEDEAGVCGVSLSALLGGELWGDGGLFGGQDMLYSMPVEGVDVLVPPSTPPTPVSPPAGDPAGLTLDSAAKPKPAQGAAVAGSGVEAELGVGAAVGKAGQASPTGGSSLAQVPAGVSLAPKVRRRQALFFNTAGYFSTAWKANSFMVFIVPA